MLQARAFCNVMLSSRNRKNVSELPKRNKCILGVTSMWMLFPIAHGMLQWVKGDVDNGQKAVIIALCCSCSASTIFWFDAKTGSLFHKLDWFSAVQYFTCMILVTAMPGKGSHVLSPAVSMFLPLCIIILFLLGDMCFERRMYKLQLLFHILFRYAGYWWAHLLLVPTEANFSVAFLILTVAYFGHILLFDLLARRRDVLWTRNLYCTSCALLVMWILVCAQLHCMSLAVTTINTKNGVF